MTRKIGPLLFEGPTAGGPHDFRQFRPLHFHKAVGDTVTLVFPPPGPVNLSAVGGKRGWSTFRLARRGCST